MVSFFFWSCCLRSLVSLSSVSIECVMRSPYFSLLCWPNGISRLGLSSSIQSFPYSLYIPFLPFVMDPIPMDPASCWRSSISSERSLSASKLARSSRSLIVYSFEANSLLMSLTFLIVVSLADWVSSLLILFLYGISSLCSIVVASLTSSLSMSWIATSLSVSALANYKVLESI